MGFTGACGDSDAAGLAARKNVPRSFAAHARIIIFGGDIMLSRFVGQLAHGLRDPASPFRDLAPVLASADIAFANLESPFSDRGRIYDSRMVFKAGSLT